MVKYISKHRYWIAGIFLFFILRLPSLFEPYWYGDEGIYLTLGQAIRHGSILFSQIHDNKPPTLYYLAAIGQTVFGFRLLLIFFMAGASIFFYYLSKKLVDDKSAVVATFIFLVLSSIPFVEGNIANAEVFMLLPTILAFYIFFFPESRIKYLVSGLLLGFAFTIKIPVAVEFGLLFLLTLSKINLKKNRPTIIGLFYFFFGFTIPIGLWAIYFLLNKAFPEFIFASLLQNFGYLSSWSTGTHSGSATSGGLINRAIILLIGWAFIYLLRLRNKISQPTLFILGWFIATIFGALLSSRPYPHYLIQVLPPLSLIITMFLHKKRLYAVPIFVFIYIIFQFKFYFYEPISYYSNFYSYAFGITNQSRYFAHFNPHLNEIYQVANYIKNNSTPDEKLFIWGDEPYIYPLSQRLPTSKYTVAYHVIDFNQHDFVYQQLITNPPKFIVYYQMNGRQYPQLNHLVGRYYSSVSAFGSATIFQNNSTLP